MLAQAHKSIQCMHKSKEKKDNEWRARNSYNKWKFTTYEKFLTHCIALLIPNNKLKWFVQSVEGGYGFVCNASLFKFVVYPSIFCSLLTLPPLSLYLFSTFSSWNLWTTDCYLLHPDFVNNNIYTIFYTAAKILHNHTV